MNLHKIAQNAIIYNTNVDVAFIEYKTILYGYRLKLIVVVGKTDKLIEKSFIEEFSAAAMVFVKAAHGSGDEDSTLTVAINILMGDLIDPSAIKYSRKSRISKIGERDLPVIYDINLKKYYTFNWYNLWGFAHSYYYLRTIKKIISYLEKHDLKLFRD
jgi:hypothetical protein